MGKIKELRDKVKNGTATEEEVTELKELETEAAETEEKPEDKTAEEEKAFSAELITLGKTLGEIALKSVKDGLAEDAKKGAIAPVASEKQEDLTGKEKVKAFFVALFENDHVKLDTLSEGSAGEGGYLVPEEYSSDFINARQDRTVMRRAGATQVPVTSDTFNLPQLSTRPKAYWAAELAAKSSTSASWSNITLTPYTLACIMTASNQVIADAKIGGRLMDVVTDLMTRAIAVAEDRAFFIGSGSGQPTGLTTYTSVSTVAPAGSVLVYQNFIDAIYALGEGYRNDACWFMNARTMRVVRGLKDSQNRPIFLDALTRKDMPTLLGYPVYEQNDMPSAQIWFGVPSSYWIADREGITVAQSDTTVVGGVSMFERNMTAIRVEERVDGELADVAGFVRITPTGVA